MINEDTKIVRLNVERKINTKADHYCYERFINSIQVNGEPSFLDFKKTKMFKEIKNAFIKGVRWQRRKMGGFIND